VSNILSNSERETLGTWSFLGCFCTHKDYYSRLLRGVTHAYRAVLMRLQPELVEVPPPSAAELVQVVQEVLKESPGFHVCIETGVRAVLRRSEQEPFRAMFAKLIVVSCQ